MKPINQQLINLILDCLFPSLCLACRSRLKSEKEKKFSLCEKCRLKITVNEHIYCSECRNRIPISPTSPTRPRCHENANFLLAATNYENPVIRELIHNLKYKQLTSALIPITELFIKPYLKKISPQLAFPENQMADTSYTLVPIPLHKSKERKRGFNQSELIAKTLAQFPFIERSAPALPVLSCVEGPAPSHIEGSRVEGCDPRAMDPHVIRALVRIRRTRTQTEMKDQKSREANVRRCFTVNNRWLEELKSCNLTICNHVIVLVDDVCTSGSTLKEAARALRANGLRSIILFVLAKT